MTDQPPAYLLDTVVYALRRNPDGATCNTLALLLGEPEFTIAQVLHQLQERGQVDRRTDHSHNRPVITWSLRPEASHG